MSDVARESELTRRIDGAMEALRPTWSDARAAGLEEEVRRRLRRRSVARRALAATGTMAVVAAVALLAGWPSAELAPATTAPPQALTAPAVPVRLGDGSTVTPLDALTMVDVREAQPARTAVHLERGGARFDVTPRADRLFEVVMGGVTVRVLGTAFVVEPVRTQVRVAVDRGRVLVLWDGGSTELAAGGSGLFPPVEEALRPAPSTGSPAASSAGQRHGEKAGAGDPARVRRRSWRDLAQGGEFDAAWGALRREGTTAVRDEPEDLLLAADVARLSRHPEEALAHLEGLLARYGRDPRASLAAFTLGRVLLEELGRPGEAARAFARSRAIDPRGELSQDALAREVEAWSRAGDPLRARGRAEEYLRLHPDGRKVKSVRRFGAVE